MAGKVLRFQPTNPKEPFPKQHPLRPKSCILNLVKAVGDMADCQKVLDHLSAHPEESKDIARMICGDDKLLSTQAIMVFSLALSRKVDLRPAIPVLEENLTAGSPSHAASLLLEVYGNANQWEKVDELLRSKHPCVRDGIFANNLTTINPEFRQSLFEYYEDAHGVPIPKDLDGMRALLRTLSIRKIHQEIDADSGKMDDLVTLINDPNPLIKSAAAAALLSIGPEAVEGYAPGFILCALDDEHFNVADVAAATLALHYVHNSDERALEKLLTHENPMARYGAARALSEKLKAGRDSSFLLRIFATLPADDHPEVRSYMESQLFDATKSNCGGIV